MWHRFKYWMRKLPLARVRPLMRWYDFWVGVYWDRKRKYLYLLPIPCFGLVIEMGPPAHGEGCGTDYRGCEPECPFQVWHAR